MQSVLVLGGTSEIGVAIVRAVGVRPGGRVVLAGRDEAALKKAGEAGFGPGVSVETAVYDALDPAAHDALVAESVAKFGDLDLVIAAAGVLGDQQVAEDDTLAAVAVMQANYVGVASVLLAVARQLRKQGHGTIVVLSSVAGLRARRSNFLYGSTKAGLDAFATGLGDALVGSGARVVVVRPGFVTGRMTAGMDRAPLSTTPEAVGTAVAAGLLAGHEVIYAPSQLRWLFVVLRLLPRALFRRLPR